MVKKLLIGVVILVFGAVLGLFFRARAVLGQDAVRTALAAQVSKAIGQPVTIGGIGATIYPRVTVNLDEVTLGEPARVQIRTVHVGTDFRALLSRRIEHASLRLTGARIELPLPPLGGASAAPSVQIDVADMARRALRNRATEETQKALKKGLGGLLKRP